MDVEAPGVVSTIYLESLEEHCMIQRNPEPKTCPPDQVEISAEHRPGHWPSDGFLWDFSTTRSLLSSLEEYGVKGICQFDSLT